MKPVVFVYSPDHPQYLFLEWDNCFAINMHCSDIPESIHIDSFRRILPQYVESIHDLYLIYNLYKMCI